VYLPQRFLPSYSQSMMYRLNFHFLKGLSGNKIKQIFFLKFFILKSILSLFSCLYFPGFICKKIEHRVKAVMPFSMLYFKF